MNGVGQVIFAFFEDYLKTRRASGQVRFEAIGTR
jgi:hypothetical protein